MQELAQQARISEGSLRGLVGIKDPIRQMTAAQRLRNPTRKTKPAGKKTGTTERKRRGKATLRTSTTTRRAPSAPWPLLLIKLARRLERRNIKEIGRELGESVKSKKECQAVAHLGEALKEVQPSDQMDSSGEDATSNDPTSPKKKVRE